MTTDLKPQLIDQAEAFGDTVLRVQLEDIVRDETTHREEAEKLLKEDDPDRRMWECGNATPPPRHRPTMERK